jgi:hypothetical protein
MSSKQPTCFYGEKGRRKLSQFVSSVILLDAGSVPALHLLIAVVATLIMFAMDFLAVVAIATATHALEVRFITF